MKLRPINAPDAPQALGGYAQAIEVTGAVRTLYISGQIPAGIDGVVPETFEDQALRCWQNIIAQLRAAEMTLDNLVQVRIFLSDRKHIADYRKVRQEVLQGRPTLVHEMAEIVELRRQGLRAVKELQSAPSAQKAEVQRSAGELVQRMRRFFGL